MYWSGAGEVVLKPSVAEFAHLPPSASNHRHHQRRIYGEGIATGLATFETTVPSRASLDAKWLREHRWVAETCPGSVSGVDAVAVCSCLGLDGCADTDRLRHQAVLCWCEGDRSDVDGDTGLLGFDDGPSPRYMATWWIPAGVPS